MTEFTPNAQLTRLVEITDINPASGVSQGYYAVFGDGSFRSLVRDRSVSEGAFLEDLISRARNSGAKVAEQILAEYAQSTRIVDQWRLGEERRVARLRALSEATGNPVVLRRAVVDTQSVYGFSYWLWSVEKGNYHVVDGCAKGSIGAGHFFSGDEADLNAIALYRDDD